MIYRIAIYSVTDGKRKFDHYASDEEMENLKVSSDGKVWHYQIEEYLINPVNGQPVYRFIETDFSDTHEVEWGYKLFSQEVFTNDILETIYHEVYEVGTMPTFFMSLSEMGLRKNKYKVIGNIHEVKK